MRISFERSGGFAGMKVRGDWDSALLPAEEERQICRLIDEARFFELPEKIENPTQGADRFCYRLSIELEDQTHTVEVGEGAIPENLQPLIQRLTQLLRATRR